MASETESELQCSGKNIPRTKRKLQKHLRSAGLAYVSRTGKIIPAKQVSEELCQCPHKCNDRVTRAQREHLFTYFYHTLGDANEQNQFLRAHMDVRARVPPPVQEVPRLPGTRPPRRITCKYIIPLMEDALSHPPSAQGDRSGILEICQKAFCSAFVISTKRVRLQREKLIHSMGLNSYHHQKKNPKNSPLSSEEGAPLDGASLKRENNNEYDQREILRDDSMMEIQVINRVLESGGRMIDMECSDYNSMKKCLVDDPLIPLGITVPEGVTIAPVAASPENDRDIAIVNNFFSNQLWKPEYIGTAYS